MGMYFNLGRPPTIGCELVYVPSSTGSERLGGLPILIQTRNHRESCSGEARRSKFRRSRGVVLIFILDPGDHGVVHTSE